MTAFLFVLAFLAFIGVVTALARGSMNAWDDGHPVRAALLGIAGILVFAGGAAFVLEGPMT